MADVDGTSYRDLNHNGVMDAYEDPRRPVAERVRDLVSRMTVAEKVGQLCHPQAEVDADGALVEDSGIFLPLGATHAIRDKHITHLLAIRLPKDSASIARWHNRVQAIAEGTRLGIPITVSTDPLHSNVDNVATGIRAASFSEWPEALGFAALRDPDAVREFAEIARREYVAVGIRSALHPQIDLATEPRWCRQSGTFGPDAELAGAFARAYLAGFQGTSSRADALTSTSVGCMTKHFPGGGPQKDGEDPHFAYGREQVYPGGMFEYHLRPFLDAIDAGTSALMPYYGMPVGLERNGRPIESVGFAFNKDVITGILRDELGYDGVVCTDWGVITDYTRGDFLIAQARAWGVEHLDRGARVAKALDAGCDQLGGESDTELLISLVESGTIDEARLDESVGRLLKVKFELGLFDDPYVDEEAAPALVGDDDARAAGFGVQVASLVLLQDRGPLLPLASSTRVFVEGAAPESFADAVHVVERPEDADVVVVRLDAPHEARDQYILEQFFHAGSLEFSTDVVERVRTLAQSASVIADVRLERPAILTPLIDVATVVIGNFGSSDRALARGLTTAAAMRGRLPFQLPRSIAGLERNKPDVPHDLDDVLFPEGHTALTAPSTGER